MCSTLISVIICTSCNVEQYEEDDYQLVFSDEFNEQGMPSNKWLYDTNDISSKSPLWTNKEENVYVKDGCLHIVMTEDDKKQLNYSASINTKESFNMCYGKLECKLKIPKEEQNCYSQIILQGNKYIWPENGEIDVAWLGGNEVISDIGWGSETKWQANWIYNKIPLFEYDSLNKAGYDVFHVIRMEWNKDSIRTWCDDRPILDVNISGIHNSGVYDQDINKSNPFLYAEDGFGHYITIRLNSRGFINGSAEMMVDYIRVWQRTRLPE